VTRSIKMSLITQRNPSLKMVIARSIATLMCQIIIALSCVFDITATLFSVSLSADMPSTETTFFFCRLDRTQCFGIKRTSCSTLLVTPFNVLSLNDPDFMPFKNDEASCVIIHAKYALYRRISKGK